MASIFNTLNMGYSGLNAAQVGINTTSHNITNAEVDGYSRQRVVAAAATPISTGPGNIGNGTEIQTIKRVFDNFVYDRYTDTYAKKEYSDVETQTLETLSTYFPEIDEVGIKADLHEYYNMWQTFADNPDNDSIKIALAKQTEVLSTHITYTKNQVTTLQSQLNNQLETNINEVNSLAEELTQINKAIDTAEAGSSYPANDLRDKRNVIERDLSRLIGAKSNTGLLESNIQVDSGSNMKTGSYTLTVGGFNIVDGSSYHPIHVANDNNASGFLEISYEREDGVLIPMEEDISGGKIGALLDLRGGTIDTTSGVPNDGILQTTIAQLDAFALGLIESTNNIYARSSNIRMDSNLFEGNEFDSIVTTLPTMNEGSFNLVVYDIDGNVAASREISVDAATVMGGVINSNSIEGQMTAEIDDNEDGNANNDIDNYLKYDWANLSDGNSQVVFTMDAYAVSNGYTFTIEDNLPDKGFSSGTNFAGALGMNRYFDGSDASSIDLNFSLKENPTTISASYTPVSGDNRLALDMVQHQFEDFDYDIGDATYDTTAYGMFDIIATDVGIQTNAAIMKQETISTQFNAIEMEYFATSQVSIDEEMTNLIKYQTAYGAAAKIITTIDQMMDTLLGLKR